MTRSKALVPLALLVLASCRNSEAPGNMNPPPPEQSMSVLTQHNDNNRTGWNSSETALNTANVNAQHFGMVFQLPVDDQVYAQPLVAGHVSINGAFHNVVIVATVNNSVYAFDGDNGALYWQKNFTAAGMRPPQRFDMTGACSGGYQDFSFNIGIVGTPVIDATTGRIYFVARSTDGAGAYVQHLHAINIIDGSEVAGSPTQINASVPGNGDGSVNGVVSFDAQRQNQRQGLTLMNGTVYVSFSSHCDWGPYHGWILGYDASTLQQRIVYNDTPNGYAGGMWESGAGMASDAGNLYVVTGNGTVGDAGDPTNLKNRGSSALKLTPSGNTLSVASYFTPYNYDALNNYDLDYGGMGALLIPNSTLYLTGGKDGNLYLLDRDNMGGFSPSSNNVHQVVALGSNNINMHCQAAYYKGGSKEFVYVWSENDPLRAIPLTPNGLLSLNSEMISTLPGPTGQSGAILSVSSNGAQAGTAILWASYAWSGDAEHDVRPGILRAFDANDVNNELWDNQQNPSDAAGNYAKFSAPTVANGHVYLPTFSNKVAVYGLR
ncbi:MAG TPA: hypothetical protein VFP26_02740 [Gemmatimonadaceae bacterium]|jgi:hypothetical protein|nr:hypothetical protein [Gemmatimonadaceae bacterium]